MLKKINILFILILGSLISNAQILNRIKHKIERRVEQKLEDKVSDAVSDKIDQKIDEALEDDENSDSEISTNQKNTESNEKSKKMEDKFASMFGSKPKQSVYSFKGQINMTISTEGEKSILSEQYFSTSEKQYAMRILSEDANQGDALMVFADDQIISFMDSDGKKSLFVIPANLGEQMANKMSPENDYDKSKLKKTGRSKRILGYLCNEYTMKDDDDNDIISWVTLDLDIPNFFNKQTKNQMEGYPLETIIINDQGKKVTIKVTKIDLNRRFELRTAEYGN